MCLVYVLWDAIIEFVSEQRNRLSSGINIYIYSFWYIPRFDSVPPCKGWSWQDYTHKHGPTISGTSIILLFEFRRSKHNIGNETAT